MTTNYLIRIEFKFNNVVAWLYWNFIKALNYFRSWYSLLRQVNIFWNRCKASAKKRTHSGHVMPYRSRQTLNTCSFKLLLISWWELRTWWEVKQQGMFKHSKINVETYNQMVAKNWEFAFWTQTTSVKFSIKWRQTSAWYSLKDPWGTLIK